MGTEKWEACINCHYKREIDETNNIYCKKQRRKKFWFRHCRDYKPAIKEV